MKILACDRLDIEKLRPKPLELDISSSTPPQRYYADSQPRFETQSNDLRTLFCCTLVKLKIFFLKPLC